MSPTCKILCVAAVALLNCAATCHKIHDTEVCSVAGIMSAGMDCVHSQTDSARALNLQETIDFLEPQIPDPKTKKPGRAGAMCMSAEYFNLMKTDLDVICEKISCSDEIKQEIRSTSQKMDRLQSQAIGKKKKEKKLAP